MTYQPIVIGGGLTAWRLLQKSAPLQSNLLSKSGEHQRDIKYFSEKAKTLGSAADMVDDRRLLRVALTAHGLSEDLNNRAFLRKMLTEDVTDSGALVNKLADKRYRDFAMAAAKAIQDPSKTIEQYKQGAFETALGETQPSMRMALYAERQISQIAQSAAKDSTKWYRILGDPPLRKVFETALGLPTKFANIPIEQQLGTLQEKLSNQLGITIRDLAEPEQLGRLIDRYVIRDQVTANATLSGAAVALSLLGGAQ